MKLIGDPVEQAKQYYADSRQNGPLLPELWRQRPECRQTEHRIQQTVQEFIDIFNFRQRKAVARLMRQKKNTPHDQGHME